jgi:hypothetical protein
MLISHGMHANENDKIEVLDVNDSRKLNNIPEGKRVIAQFTGSAQPVGKSGVRWRRTTEKMIRSGRSSEYRMIGRRYHKTRRRSSLLC